MSSYEEHFEQIKDRSIIISDLIEQIIKVDEVLSRHRLHNSQGLEYRQFLAKRKEFTSRLNEVLSEHKMELVHHERA
ncbi:MAG: hypothetical protein AAF544_08775 [Bacteroidota bacterium]